MPFEHGAQPRDVVQPRSCRRQLSSKKVILAVATCFASSSIAVRAETLDETVQRFPVEQLKLVFLGCNQQALNGLLSFGDATFCSVVYESLKARAFDGNFDRLLAWSQAQTRLASLETQIMVNQP